MKINPALCFSPHDLAQVLNNAENEDDTLIYEIGQAVTFRLFFEKYLGWNKYFIYFEPKVAAQSELLKKIGTIIKHKEIAKFISAYSEQSTPVDFYYIRTDSSPAEVYPVQAKRFGMQVDPKTVTDALIGEFEKWSAKYSSSETTLLVHFQNSGELDIPQLNEWLNNHQFPFREVIIETLGKKLELKLCQVYPNGGDINTLVFPADQVISVNE